MTLPSILKIASTLACIIAAGASSANNNSTASFTHFSYTLIDLDPNDGMTPSITFGNLSPSQVQVLSYQKDFDITYKQGLVPLAPVSVTQAGTGYSGSATVSGGGTFATLGLTANSEIANAGPSSLSTRSWASLGSSTFQLSANTGIRFYFTYSGSLHTDAISGSWDQFNVDASGELEFVMSGQGTQRRYWYADASLADLSKPYDYSWSESAVISYDNLSSHSVSGGLFGNIETSGVIANVPEPSSYAMFGAGLVMLSALRARRRQR